ncbi:hypothetical protein HZS_7335 [Henneguya salminicola]|nr:hypothetical protein HZS_7335 [Henneguya salminicola]
MLNEIVQPEIELISEDARLLSLLRCIKKTPPPVSTYLFLFFFILLFCAEIIQIKIRRFYFLLDIQFKRNISVI